MILQFEVQGVIFGGQVDDTLYILQLFKILSLLIYSFDYELLYVKSYCNFGQSIANFFNKSILKLSLSQKPFLIIQKFFIP